MYTHYFGLSKRPFAITPDPHFLYLSDLHKEALAHLFYGIEHDGCLALLTGEAGTGKTTLSRFLVEQIPGPTDIALVLNPKLTVLELLKTICEELLIDCDGFQNSIKYYIDILNAHLLATHAQGRNTILIIDEAQDLDPDVLEQLRLLTNLETRKEKLLKIMLLGQPELLRMLEKPEFSQVNQRITSRYHLQPLRKRDVFNYVEHRVRIAGGGRARLFSDKSLKRIHALSRGIPRLINLLCDRSLIGAYVEEKDQVDRKIVDKAAREVFGRIGKTRGRILGSFSPRHPWAMVGISVVAMLLVTGAALFFRWPQVVGDANVQDQAVAAAEKNTIGVAMQTAPEQTEETPPQAKEKPRKIKRSAKRSGKNKNPGPGVESPDQ